MDDTAPPELIEGGRSPHGERGLKYLLSMLWIMSVKSLPSRGAWIEIGGYQAGRGRGVKSLPSRGAWIEIRFSARQSRTAAASLPSRGAWIEILTDEAIIYMEGRRSPHGERGLKLEWAAKELCGDRRSPHGERGLK